MAGMGVGSILSLILGGAGAGAGVLGQSRAGARNQSNQVNNLNSIDQFIQQFSQQGQGFLPPALGPINNIANGGRNGLTPTQQDIFGQAQNALDTGNNLFSQVDPLGRDLIAQSPTANESFGIGQEILSNRGTTGALDFLEDRSNDLFAAANGLAPANVAALDIINNRGATDETTVCNVVDGAEGRGQETLSLLRELLNKLVD